MENVEVSDGTTVKPLKKNNELFIIASYILACSEL